TAMSGLILTYNHHYLLKNSMTVFLLLKVKVYAYHHIEDVSYVWDYLELDQALVIRYMKF
ncbi:MAG: hypothetical protein ACLTMR_10220, partial [Faecalibacillus sp.]